MRNVGVDIKHLAEKTGLRKNTVSYDINQMRHKAEMQLAANRKVDALDVKAVQKFKKASAQMLNSAMIGSPSTIEELNKIIQSIADKMKQIAENAKRKAI
jgi:hypothetical protein